MGPVPVAALVALGSGDGMDENSVTSVLVSRGVASKAETSGVLEQEFASIEAGAAKLTLGIPARGYTGTDREISQYEKWFRHTAWRFRRPCQVTHKPQRLSAISLWHSSRYKTLI